MPGELIVRYRPGTSAVSRTGALRSAGARVKRQLLLADTALVSVGRGEERAAMARLNRDRSVVYAEPNAIVHADASPNDPSFGQLWGLNNTGQSINGVAGVRDADIDAPEAWNMGFGLGSTVRVAVIDTGVARSHADLAPNMFTNQGRAARWRPTASTTTPTASSTTGAAGTSSTTTTTPRTTTSTARTWPARSPRARTTGSASAGVAAFPHTTTSAIWFGPKIVAVKVLNAAGSGSIAGIADGIVYAGRIGAKVGNLSLGGAGTSLTYDDALRASPNTLFAIAAGNDGADNDTSPHSPCVPNGTDPPNKICVAATDNKDALADFSNFGATQVDLAAPGVDILSTVPTPAASFSDTFETGITGRWTTNDAGQTGTPRWARTTLFHTSGASSLTDSPGGTAAAPALYANNQNNWARNTNAINLTGLIGVPRVRPGEDQHRGRLRRLPHRGLDLADDGLPADLLVLRPRPGLHRVAAPGELQRREQRVRPPAADQRQQRAGRRRLHRRLRGQLLPPERVAGDLRRTSTAPRWRPRTWPER